jgi:hypothetical protein
MPDTSPLPDAPGLDELGAVLDEMAERAEQLVGLLREQRDAVRAMNPDAIGDATARQSAVVLQLDQLERRRRALAGAGSLAELAARLPASRRARTLASAARIGQAARALGAETAIMRACAGAMLGHIEGLMRAVSRQLSHTGAYTHRGVVGAGPQVISGVDITR